MEAIEAKKMDACLEHVGRQDGAELIVVAFGRLPRGGGRQAAGGRPRGDLIKR